MSIFKNAYILMMVAWFMSASSSTAQQAEDSIKIHGTVRTPDGIEVPYTKIMFISHGDTLSQLTSEAYPGEYEFDVQKDTITAIDESDGTITRSFELRQNFPNPFNPATTIEYTIEKTAHVELTVFNVLGQQVRCLENDLKAPGVHRITWDGHADDGSSVAAGLYFYRLRTGGNVMTRKMLLIDGGPGTALSGSSVQRLAKPERETLREYEVIALKDGYDTYRETGFTVSATDTEVTKDIMLTPQFEPGDYFPLAVGNTWEFLTLGSTRWEITYDFINGEYATGVIDSRTIDGKEYYVLDRWTHFLPTIFWSDDVDPLVRIDDAGTFILRYGDVDIPLYPFAETSFFYSYDLYDYLMDNDPAMDGKQEKYEAFKNVELEIYAGEDYCASNWTASGTYDNCRKINISEGRGIVECKLYFNQDAGPVHCEIYDLPGETTVFGNSLKRAHIGGKRYGVPANVLNSDTITNADITELLRMIFDRSFVRHYVPYSRLSKNPVIMTNIVVSKEKFPYWHLLPQVPNITLDPMDYNAIIQKAENQGKFCFYLFSYSDEFSITGNRVTLDFGVRVTPVDCMNFGDCGGSGATYEFTPSHGVWTARKTGSWHMD